METAQETPSPRARIERLRRLAAQAWVEIRDGFQDPFDGPSGEELRAAHRETLLSRTTILVWISIVVMPTTLVGYTLIFASHQLPRVLLVLGAALTGSLVMRYLLNRRSFDNYYQLPMLLLVGCNFGPVAAAVRVLTAGAVVDYFFAYYLIYFAFTALFPASARWILATSGALIAGFVAVHAAAGQMDASVASNTIYLMELTFIGTVLNRVICKLFFDEKRARLELGRVNSGLMELDRAKTAFFSNISHELRTPLTLILTPLTFVLQQRPDLPPEMRDVLQGIRGNANRLLKMVNLLLDFSRVEAGKVEVSLTDVAVDDLVKYTASLFQGTAEQRGVKVVVAAETAELRVVTDVDKVEQMLVNLVGNALKFTPRGGCITLGSRREGSSFQLFVRDTGIGIAPQHQQLVFQRFGQVQEAQRASVKGTGIGLSMVQEYARVLGGRVDLVSAVGEGSTFTITLPVRESAASDGAAADRGLDRDLVVADLLLERAAEEGIRDKAGAGAPWVLVVDDNPNLVQLVASILEETYNLYLAPHGEAALARLERSPVDLVVSDVMMPGISGLELCKRIKQDPRWASVPVVLLTARGGAAQKVEGLDIGADDYIGKPFDPAELRARVRSLFERRALLKRLEDKSAELEEALKTLKDEEVKLVASEKMRTLGDLAAGIFHELHNYMNMLYNGAMPLKDLVTMMRTQPGALTDEDLAEIDELTTIMIEAAQTSLSITGELKAYAHQSSSAIKDVDIHEIIKSNVRMFGKLKPGLAIHFQLADEPLTVTCVPSRLMIVFTNLLKNAFDAMKDEGSVTIRTRRAAGWLEIQVEDVGPGVPPKFLEKLFEPFQTTKPQGKGLGLGLSLARKVVQELGGELRYDTSYTQGARFVITAPLAGRAAKAA